MNEDKLDYPATRRNREPIRRVLAECLPADGLVLEIASGSGQHVAHLAAAFPDLSWQPTDPEPSCVASIGAWTRELDNVLDPMALDVTEHPWPVDAVDAMLCINMIHIAPWEASEGLIEGASKHLAPGGLLYMYGPYQRGGRHTSPSNAAFSQDLQRRDPRWGVRDLDVVAELARSSGLSLERVVEMPANNLSVIYRRGQ
jgi:SAM-dependent methyltransferase